MKKMGSSELVPVSQGNLCFTSQSVFSIDLCPLLIHPLLMHYMRMGVCFTQKQGETESGRCFVCVRVW